MGINACLKRATIMCGMSVLNKLAEKGMIEIIDELEGYVVKIR